VLVKNIINSFFEVRHSHCVGSITKNFFLCITHTVEHNSIVVFDCMCNTQKFFVKINPQPYTRTMFIRNSQSRRTMPKNDCSRKLVNLTYLINT